MKIFAYEFITGGGTFRIPTQQATPAGSLLNEGLAMIYQLAADLVTTPEVNQVVGLWDQRLSPPQKLSPKIELIPIESRSEHDRYFKQQAADADWTVLIAPEFDRHLTLLADLVIHAGGKLLGPDPATIRLGSDKTAFANMLCNANIRCAPGIPIPAGTTRENFATNLEAADFRFELGEWLIIKPADGAGCEGVFRHPYQSDAQLFTAIAAGSTSTTHSLRVERFLPGQPASIALLCGPHGATPLRWCTQTICWNSHRPEYCGGEIASDQDPRFVNFQDRAKTLALEVAALLKDQIGYYGLDLVMGSAKDGSEDHVVELNPRLTTSYVGLSSATPENIAAAMLQRVCGESVSLRWEHLPVAFTAEGLVL